MYPVIQNGVQLEAYYSYADGKSHYVITSPDGETAYDMPKALFYAVEDADGTHPIRIKGVSQKEIAQCVEELQEAGILSTKRFVKEDRYNRFILFPIGGRAKVLQPFAWYLNRALPYLALMSVIIGVTVLLSKGGPWSPFRYVSSEINWPLYYTCLLFSCALHELGHLSAGIASDCHVSDMGILLLGYFPIGAYVSTSEPDKDQQKEAIQLDLAGIEMNLLLLGVFLVLSSICNELSWTLFYCVVANLGLTIINFSPILGLDGEETLRAVFQTDDIRALARNVVRNKNARNELKSAGMSGKIALAILSYVYIFPVIASIAVTAWFGFIVYLWIP